MKKKIFKKILLIIFVITVIAYGILVLMSQKKYEVEFGLSYSPEYAESLGLDSRKVYNEILNDLKPKYIRLSVPWSRVEKNNNQYSFENFDYLMNEAEKNDVKVILSIGQKVPRWPECYIPDWLRLSSKEQARSELLSYIETVVNRYKNHKALEYWQVENEPFIKFEFGECGTFDESSVKNEVDFVKKIDPNHKIIMTDSGELSTWRRASKMGDILGVTVYRVVRTRYGMVWSHNWVPASLYNLRAKLWGRTYDDFYVAELQAEPWFGGSVPATTEISIQEQTSSLSQLSRNIEFAKKVGASRAYFWGVEWWYWMKEAKGNPDYWNLGKEELGS